MSGNSSQRQPEVLAFHNFRALTGISPNSDFIFSLTISLRAPTVSVPGSFAGNMELWASPRTQQRRLSSKRGVDGTVTISRIECKGMGVTWEEARTRRRRSNDDVNVFVGRRARENA